MTVSQRHTPSARNLAAINSRGVCILAKKGDDASLDAIKGMRCRRTREHSGLFGAARNLLGLEDLQSKFYSKKADAVSSGQTS